MFDIATRFKNSYGSGPLHLLAMVSGFALVGYWWWWSQCCSASIPVAC